MVLPIAERIKTLRMRSMMTRTDLANKLGVTRSSVNAWEMGISVPTTDKIVEIALLYGTTTDYIFGLEERQMVDLSNVSPNIKDILSELVRYLNTVNSSKNEN